MFHPQMSHLRSIVQEEGAASTLKPSCGLWEEPSFYSCARQAKCDFADPNTQWNVALLHSSTWISSSVPAALQLRLF